MLIMFLNKSILLNVLYHILYLWNILDIHVKKLIDIINDVVPSLSYALHI